MLEGNRWRIGAQLRAWSEGFACEIRKGCEGLATDQLLGVLDGLRELRDQVALLAIEIETGLRERP